jgi:hypothetical protein
MSSLNPSPIGSKQDWIVHLRDHCPESIHYTTNAEYRQFIRSIFLFDPSKQVTHVGDDDQGTLIPKDQMDAETADEVSFDQSAVDRGLKQWYEWTEDDPDFLEVYTHAAYKMITTNPEVGQCVVASYQTFDLYYQCIRAYLLRKKMAGPMAQLARFYQPNNDDKTANGDDDES